MIRTKLLAGTVALVLSLTALAAPASAMTLIGSSNIYSKPGIDSSVRTGSMLSVEDAAMRLYYLGMLTGSGTNLSGGIEFRLSNGLTRVESAVFAVRLLGMEQEALEGTVTHPYTDVPDWASGYVGVLYGLGLLDDVTGTEFAPDMAETTERFMSYMLYALGYRMEEGDYTYYMAAEYARDAGICLTSRDAPLTRGGAVLAMYNTLRATMKDSDRVYSDLLVERGVISYRDAVFLLWCRRGEETEAYMDAVGYGTQWVVPDGYYKIRASQGGMLLNVAVSGMNSDYEGVPVTLWEGTDDITQTFRIERTERGTYYLYSAASRYGYGRVLGKSLYGDGMGLYSATGQSAMEFEIEGAADGSWIITSAADGRSLSAKETGSNGAAVTLAESGDAAVQSWEFDRQGVLNEYGEELAIFASNSLLITQGAFDTYSHMTQNALDFYPMEGAVRAPFNATIVRMDASYAGCNAVWIQSNEKVRYADGTYDYMTVSFLHDNDISDLAVGMGLKQGEYFYHSGTYGVSTGKHVHMAIYRGQYHSGMPLGGGDVYAQNALFLPDDTYVYDAYGIQWTQISYSRK